MLQGPSHSQTQTVSLNVNTMAIQSIAILQYSQQELHAFLSEQAERNPVISLGDFSPGRVIQDSPAGERFKTGARPQTHNRIGAQSDLPQIAETHAQPINLHSHLETQARLYFRDARSRNLAAEIIGSIDADGYLRRPLEEIADFNGSREDELLPILETIQQFEPTGVAARNLAECMRLQLSERGNLTPELDIILRNLDLVAKHEIDRLARLTKTSRAEVLEMIRSLRALNPAPGRQFDCDPLMPALPDVLVNERSPGTFSVELNPELLPRVLIDRNYYSEVSLKNLDRPTRRYIRECFRAANWLTHNLDLRAQTLLKVTSELVRQQHGFFLHGASAMRPLQLKTVADAIGVHESTVSRAISNKYLMTACGLYPLKYFFTERLGAEGVEDGVAATAIRHRIADMIQNEKADHILSDEAIVGILNEEGIEVARRTVAKYRMAMKIPTSTIRRRQKNL